MEAYDIFSDKIWFLGHFFQSESLCGGGGMKNPEKLPKSFMDGPLYFFFAGFDIFVSETA
jgi:hypothetical protein